jgi:hypothetical protein
MGMKKPLVNPATADNTGESRRDFFWNVRMSQMSRAVHVWFRAVLTNAIWKNSAGSQRLDSTSLNVVS